MFEREVNRSDQLLTIRCTKCKTSVATAQHVAHERIDNGKRTYTSFIACMGKECSYHVRVELETSMMEAMEQAWWEYTFDKGKVATGELHPEELSQ